MKIEWEDLFMGRIAIGWRSTTATLKLWTTKFMNLVIEQGRACWAVRN